MRASMRWACLLAFILSLLAACGHGPQDHSQLNDDSNSFSDPWAMRMMIDTQDKTAGPNDEAYRSIVRQELAEIRQLLYQVLNDKKNGENDARLDYLASKLATIDQFTINFNDPSGAASVAPSFRTVLVDRTMMDPAKRYQRYFTLAHELGHLLSVPAYLGTNGLNFFEPGTTMQFIAFNPQKGPAFANYTLDNYPFLDELKFYAGQGVEGLEYVMADPATKQDILEEVQRLTNDLLYIRYTINNLNRAEYENFRPELLLEALYLGSTWQKKTEVFSTMRGRADWAQRLTKANSRIDETMAEYFAIKALEKKVQQAEAAGAAPEEIEAWANGGFTFLRSCEPYETKGWDRCMDPHPNIDQRRLMHVLSPILAHYCQDPKALAKL